MVAVGQLQRGRPTMGVADTGFNPFPGLFSPASGFGYILALTLLPPGRDRAATSLCSQGLSGAPTLAPMLKAPPKPGLAVMLSTLVKFVKVFQFVQNIFDWIATT